MAEKLDELHLADLHELASELGVPRFRLLRRAELVSEIEARRGAAEPSVAEPAPESEPEAGAGAEAEPDGLKPERERELLDTAATEEVTGVLESTPQRYGFLRLNGLETNPDDVYISASQLRRCELRPGDEVSGPARWFTSTG
jgi:transcription termination factor Rho